MQFDQVREGQENRGNTLPVSWIYTSSSTGQETEVSGIDNRRISACVESAASGLSVLRRFE